MDVGKRGKLGTSFERGIRWKLCKWKEKGDSRTVKQTYLLVFYEKKF